VDVKLSEEQIQLRDTARKFLTEECTPDFIRGMEKSELGYSPEMWRRMAEMGWLGIALPEECGGLGMSTVDAVILMKELGRRICPSPFFATVGIAAEAIARAGSESQKAGISEIVDGKRIVAFAYQEASRDFDAGAISLRAREEADGFVLDGTKLFVEYAAAADSMLVVARTSGERPAREGLTAFLIDAKRAGIACTREATIARDHHYKVEFRGVKVTRDEVLGGVGSAWRILEPVIEKAAVLFSAFVVGVSEQMHEFSTQFAKDRVQFGRPIGQMQTIQGYLASLIIEIYGANTLTMFTAFNLDKGRNVRGYVAKAKAFSAETVKNTTDVGSQIFGGMGYMEESDSTLYLRRGRQYRAMLGGTEYWEKIIAEELLDTPA
jgi:alkylation response protein AidB-like acyl-CoA dehydrogenase